MGFIETREKYESQAEAEAEAEREKRDFAQAGGAVAHPQAQGSCC